MPLTKEAPEGPSTRPVLWCDIYQVARKHVIYNYHLLQKFVQEPKQLFCNFYNLWDMMTITATIIN